MKAFCTTSFERFLSVMESIRLKRPVPDEDIEWIKDGLRAYGTNGVPLEAALGLKASCHGSTMNASAAYRYWLRGHLIYQAWQACNAPDFNSPGFNKFREIVRQMADQIASGVAVDHAWKKIQSTMDMRDRKFGQLLCAAFANGVTVPTSKHRLEQLLTSHRDGTCVRTFSDMLSGENWLDGKTS